MNSPARSWRRRGDSAPAAIESAAADWVARLDAGMSAQESAELAAWLAADARHAAAFGTLQRVWANLNRAQGEGRGEALYQDICYRAARAKRRVRRRLAFAATAFAAAAVLTVAVWPFRPVAPSRVPSIALHPDRQTLPDGSIVELNMGAQFTLEFTPERRLVRLVRGEGLFDVVKDATRPFVVVAARVEVHALGTAFSVRHAPDEIAVFVTKGRVAVDRRTSLDAGETANALPAAAARIQLAAGRTVTIPLAGDTGTPEPRELSAKEIADALAWRTHRVEFTSTPLREAVVLFNRSKTRLALADEATGALRITGVFWTDDADGFARLLEASLQLQTQIDGEARIVLRK